MGFNKAFKYLIIAICTLSVGVLAAVVSAGVTQYKYQRELSSLELQRQQQELEQQSQQLKQVQQTQQAPQAAPAPVSNTTPTAPQQVYKPSDAYRSSDEINNNLNNIRDNAKINSKTCRTTYDYNNALVTTCYWGII